MKLLQFICLVSFLMNNCQGMPWHNRGYLRQYSLRSQQGPWYRYPYPHESVDQACSYWDGRLERGSFFYAKTNHGYLCPKPHADIKILSWCSAEEAFYNNKWIILPTMLESRASGISTCEIYDITVRAVRLNGDDECFFRLTNGILSCVDNQEILPDNQILTIYPTIDFLGEAPRLKYIICSVSMSAYCPGAAKVLSSVEHEEEIQDFFCAGGSGFRC